MLVILSYSGHLCSLALSAGEKEDIKAHTLLGCTANNNRIILSPCDAAGDKKETLSCLFILNIAYMYVYEMNMKSVK